MPASFRKILNSTFVVFRVGELADGKPSVFRVHLEAVAQLSQPLLDIVDTQFMGDFVEWDYVNKRTFERLAQFAYTGDYTVPKPLEPLPSPATLNEDNATDEADTPLTPEPPADEVPPPPPEEHEEQPVQNEWGGGRGKTIEPIPEEPTSDDVPPPDEPQVDIIWSQATWMQSKKKKKKGRTVFTLVDSEPEAAPEPEPELNAEPVEEPAAEPAAEPAGFDSLSFPLVAPRDNYKDSCDPPDRFNAFLNYSNVFLCHASLWAIADIFDIDSLKALALHKLHKTLCAFKINDDNAAEVIELARYAYNEDCGQPRPDEKAGEGLRGLVTHYMVFESGVLSRSAEFSKLLGEGGRFVQDFFQLAMQKRIW